MFSTLNQFEPWQGINYLNQIAIGSKNLKSIFNMPGWARIKAVNGPDLLLMVRKLRVNGQNG